VDPDGWERQVRISAEGVREGRWGTRRGSWSRWGFGYVWGGDRGYVHMYLHDVFVVKKLAAPAYEISFPVRVRCHADGIAVGHDGVG
jgi:hypothetical protein